MCDWIHCNKCSLKYDTNVKLFLTECGHFFCERCANNFKESKCLICDKTTKVTAVSKDMEHSIKEFFMPVEACLNKAIQVYNFQMQHRSRLLQIAMQKYNFAKKECISIHNKYKNSVKENKLLRTMLMSAEQNQQPFLTSTPINKPGAPSTDNMSAMSSIGFTPSVQGGAASRPGFIQRVVTSGGHNFKGRFIYPHLSSGGSSARPSPVHMVPNLHRNVDMPAVHRPSNPTFSMEQLRRAGKRS